MRKTVLDLGSTSLRKRVIELKLLRYSHKKDYVSGKNTDLNKFWKNVIEISI